LPPSPFSWSDDLIGKSRRWRHGVYRRKCPHDTRTLTNLYNARPAWLDNAHKTLDAAVAAAYGWADYSPAMPDEEILRRLLALNLERAARSKGESP
jgi:hypothetical protein